MKMFLGNTQIKSMKVGTNTDDATLVASDLQSGVTAYAKGRKVTGTGKSFEFASYGQLYTNASRYIPSEINVIEITSLQYPVKLIVELNSMKNLDFSLEQEIATVFINNVEHALKVSVKNHILKISCDETFALEVFYGKDNYT